jgi:pilus assembly protein CpaC
MIGRTVIGWPQAMRTILVSLVALAACFIGTAAEAAASSGVVRLASAPGAAPRHMTLNLNKGVIVELDRDARDVYVSNPAIVDAVVRTPRRVFIMSLKIGQANVIFLDGAGRQIASVDVNVEPDVAALGTSIVRHLPDSGARAAAVGESVVVGGNVRSAQDARRAQDLAVRYAGAPERVVNVSNITGRQQVMIKVRVSEMSRTISKQLGIDVEAVSRAGDVPFIFQTSNPFSLLGRALSDLSGVQAQYRGGDTSIGGVLKALERVGLVRTLAEPNLTAVSGETAKFLAGGEFPVPTSRDQQGNVVVEFKQFGVGLAFTPVVLSNGRISLQVSSEVSELSSENAFVQNQQSTIVDDRVVVVQGLTVPALSVRRTETTVELPSGGSLVIGGLLQKQTKQNIDAFPGLKNLPVLGALFQSRDYQNNETELVVMVSAYLVDPVSPARLATPTQNFVPPTDGETILFGRLNAVFGNRASAAQAAAGRGNVGYIVQ